MAPSQTETRLQIQRRSYAPRIPSLLQDLKRVVFSAETGGKASLPEIAPLFPSIHASSFLKGERLRSDPLPLDTPLRIGVVFSGGPAPGGHNVVIGLYEALQQLDSEGVLLGFLNGPGGILSGEHKKLDESSLDLYRNTGGFDLLGSGRVKIETQAQLEAALRTVSKMQLSGLVVIGGDDSNTNAAVMAEYFLQKGSSTRVIGVPKTIDGDLRNPHVETSFGFDTACKTYAEIIGNIQRDALSARKYYHFIKLMGRSASHIALECALVTQPNLTWIAEEIAELQRGLGDLVGEITDLICDRAEQGKHFGVILIPEGIVECIPEIASLIRELNQLLSREISLRAMEAIQKLTPSSAQVFSQLPKEIQDQLLLHRDPHGNVQVSSIETEKLFLELVKQELGEREKRTGRHIPFSAVQHFLGYEGRSAFPSNFDCNYCFSLGVVATLLIARGHSGYMTSIRRLTSPPEQWEIGAVPLCRLMRLETRKGVLVPVITKTLVEKQDPAFVYFQNKRSEFRLRDCYRSPGPIQFFGDPQLTDSLPLTVVLNQGGFSG